MKPNHIAVITGDFVKSRSLKPELLDKGMRALENASNEVYDWQLEDFGDRSFQDADQNNSASFNASIAKNAKPRPTSKTKKFVRIQGDSWRTAIKNPRLLYRALLFLLASLRAVDDGKQLSTRISVGIGGGKADEPDINIATGDAYVESGSALESMKPDIVALGPKENAPPELTVALQLSAALYQSWTARQARILKEMLRPDQPTQKDLAAELGTTPQNVSDALVSINYRPLSRVIDTLERAQQVTQFI